MLTELDSFRTTKFANNWTPTITLLLSNQFWQRIAQFDMIKSGMNRQIVFAGITNDRDEYGPVIHRTLPNSQSRSLTERQPLTKVAVK